MRSGAWKRWKSRILKNIDKGSSRNNKLAEWKHVGLQENQNSYQNREREAVKEDVAEDTTFMPIPICSSACDDDALGINHFAHDATGTVRGGHQYWADMNLFGGDFLKAAEQNI